MCIFQLNCECCWFYGNFNFSSVFCFGFSIRLVNFSGLLLISLYQITIGIQLNFSQKHVFFLLWIFPNCSWNRSFFKFLFQRFLFCFQLKILFCTKTVYFSKLIQKYLSLFSKNPFGKKLHNTQINVFRIE